MAPATRAAPSFAKADRRIETLMVANDRKPVTGTARGKIEIEFKFAMDRNCTTYAK